MAGNTQSHTGKCNFMQMGFYVKGIVVLTEIDEEVSLCFMYNF